jgi:hypothetical protein
MERLLHTRKTTTANLCTGALELLLLLCLSASHYNLTTQVYSIWKQ